MIRSLSPAKGLAIVVAIQCLILFSVIGFKQYSDWTSETVLLKTTPVDPQELIGGDYVSLQYEISTIHPRELGGDDDFGETVYVELQRGDDGYWKAVALHSRRDHFFDDTVLIKGHTTYYYLDPGSTSDKITVTYGIEQVFVPEESGGNLPSGRNHTVAVEVKVDRFGNADPRRFIVDGEPFDLRQN